MKITEGYMPFEGFKTYYRVVGEATEGKKPLVLLHGGPGSTHNYFEVLDKIAESGRQVIMYDQIGCGNSFVEGHPELFNADTWIKELIALREHLGLDEIHLLGQSWGGMQAIWYALEYKPKGIKSYILSSTLSSASLWETEQKRRISYMDEADQKALLDAVNTGDYSSKEYSDALDKFMKMYCAGEVTENDPECLRRPKKSGAEAYVVGWGHNEFSPSGTLAGYEFTDRLHEIEEPCLITNGAIDLCSPYIAKTMYDRIPNSKWELFQYSRHMPFVEENERYMKVLNEWLEAND
ncbi:MULTISPECIES: proline iminopeptidase [Terrisporobacter]|uniref:Proline iminopeptidase n=2 Tax=Terrisporobacter TaxID=1505652 RepID=A0A0B3W7E1_9FIRM|nr:MULTISPECIES: proline iminopeptidase-family hydrolase [Terrisporobacter]KHS58307.1 proline iminopeptidase [Terrisporobacter othiniensis]MCR1823297.1 proline iminopeptidase-family hydrolase [Terrisporobacter muris]MDY3375020.1 proline iminopeptidase-family hydrolase [Terrisporobacter othiniensis]